MNNRSYRFLHLDVFTEVPLQGNPLAVFLDARGIPSDRMQQIARELNLSETVFVLPPESGGTVKARIFTPAAELAFAGHPTIGTAFALRETGIVPETADRIVLEEGVGPVPVRFERGSSFRAWLRTPPIAFGADYDRERTAVGLGLRPEDLLDLPVSAAGAGNPFVFVAVRDREAVDRAEADARALREAFGALRGNGVFVFAPVEGGAYSRMFAPEHGIAEDPATGSATGPLAAYMIRHGLVSGEDGTQLVSEQGVKMGRRSVLHVRVNGRDGAGGIEVGGSAVVLFEAQFPA